MASSGRRRPLSNITNWGTFDYTFGNACKTSYRTSHRHVPPINQHHLCAEPLVFSKKVLERDGSVMRQNYKTSSSVHQKFTKSCQILNIHEKPPCNTTVRYMAYCDDKMEKHSHGAKRQVMSETKENFRVLDCPPAILAHASCGHSPLYLTPHCCQMPYVCTDRGHDSHADPYVTTYLDHYTNVLKEQTSNETLDSSAKSDVNTWNNINDYPKIVDYGPKKRETWMSTKAEIKHAAWGHDYYLTDRLDKTVRRPLAWIPRTFVSETREKFCPPYQGFVACMS